MKQRDFVIILIPLFILTVLWVIFNVYHNLVTSTIEDPLSYQIVAIEGKFDNDSLIDILGRKRVIPTYEIEENLILEISSSDTIEEEVATESSQTINIEEGLGTISAQPNL